MDCDDFLKLIILAKSYLDSKAVNFIILRLPIYTQILALFGL